MANARPAEEKLWVFYANHVGGKFAAKAFINAINSSSSTSSWKKKAEAIPVVLGEKAWEQATAKECIDAIEQRIAEESIDPKNKDKIDPQKQAIAIIFEWNLGQSGVNTSVVFDEIYKHFTSTHPNYVLLIAGNGNASEPGYHKKFETQDVFHIVANREAALKKLDGMGRGAENKQAATVEAKIEAKAEPKKVESKVEAKTDSSDVKDTAAVAKPPAKKSPPTFHRKTSDASREGTPETLTRRIQQASAARTTDDTGITNSPFSSVRFLRRVAPAKKAPDSGNETPDLTTTPAKKPGR